MEPELEKPQRGTKYRPDEDQAIIRFLLEELEDGKARYLRVGGDSLWEDLKLPGRTSAGNRSRFLKDCDTGGAQTTEVEISLTGT